MGDEIVITGISGKFPNSENVQMLQHNLLNKIDCVNNENPRWECSKYFVFFKHFFSENFNTIKIYFLCQ